MNFNELNSKKSDLYFDAFIISFVGIYGLYSINRDNNRIVLKLKKSKEFLHRISPDSLDFISEIYRLYVNKEIPLMSAKSYMDFIQIYRENTPISDENEEKLKELIEQIPSKIYRRLNGDIKLFLKAYLMGVYKVEDLVSKFYSYGLRKKFDIDFIKLAKTMVRK